MLYVCIPTHNEAVTVGVLLWRLRTILREHAGGRDFEIVVFDDASTDATGDVLAPYTRVMPLTVLGGPVRVGQSAATEALVRHVVADARAPESDAVVLLQADYTDVPELLPDLLRLFDGGADVVLTRRAVGLASPVAERRLRRAAGILLPTLVRSAVRNDAARDPAALLGSMRLVRVSVLRDAARSVGADPLVHAPGWAGTVELALQTVSRATHVEVLDVPARYDVRTRPSRLNWSRELRAVAALLWQRRGAERATPTRPGRRSASAPTIVPATGRADAPTARDAGRDREAARPAAPRIVRGGARRAARDADAAHMDAAPAPIGPPAKAAPQLAGRAGARAPTRAASTTRDAVARAAPDVPIDAAVDTVLDAPDAPPTIGDGSAAPKSRRRRRGRGRTGASAQMAAEAIEAPEIVPEIPDQSGTERPAPPITRGAPLALVPAAPDDAMDDAPTASGSDSAPDDGESAGSADAPSPDTPGAAPRRRRRRGGARRRAGGSPGESGVEPSEPGTDAPTWQGAPSDQPSP